MKTECLVSVLFALVLGLGWSLAWADDPPQFPQNATFSTLVKTSFPVEGLTGDATGDLYTTGRQTMNGVACPVYRVNIVGGASSLAVVGYIPAPSGTTLCSPNGLAFNSVGDLFVADGGVPAAKIYTLIPDTVRELGRGVRPEY